MSEPVPEYGVCIWPVDPGCLSTEWEDTDPEIQDRSLAYASASLHRLTGYRVGGCPITVRPCAPRCGRGLAYTGWSPSLWNGEWVNGCGHLHCHCETLCDISLPGPVGEVIEVRSGGAVVDPSDYEVRGTHVVYVGGGDCPWTATQDLSLPLTEPGTLAVTYRNSYPVDGLGANAVGILAMEFAKLCTGSNKCRFPATVRSIARQGVTFDIISGMFPNGQTGIREVDAYIGNWNPNGLRQEAQVWFPGQHKPQVI